MKKTNYIAFFVVALAGLFYLVLTEKPALRHSQEPIPPDPYYSEEVSFKNVEDSITLLGTLTLPNKEGNFPVVILITGSGPQDRNIEVFGHKPFLVIADYFTRQGLAVLRYDDRGIGKSTGSFMTATSQDFASDAISALNYLKTRSEINVQKIGLLGHSEGGLVSAIAASQCKEVRFVISLAGLGARGLEALGLQTELIARAGGVNDAGIALIKKSNREVEEILNTTPDTTVLRKALTAYFKANGHQIPEEMVPPGQSKAKFFENSVNFMCTPWYQWLLKVDPADFYGKIACPVLALNGSKDLQVDAKQNLPLIYKAVKNGGNPNVAIKELPNLNHFFQNCNTGHPNEYADIQETFSPLALTTMTDWISMTIDQNINRLSQ
ncbi:alpha/beta hydrolase family protein [Dyadobacter tibetensis]|uniref:alpha/beta hydrolase family protein n=1 Tax=Dyadobacter tibetensis TaxID=1211851 RepID=UPI00046EB9A6|nr:alpha/beta fold hydrolase [Dyadobacter tibetensis]